MVLLGASLWGLICRRAGHVRDAGGRAPAWHQAEVLIGRIYRRCFVRLAIDGGVVIVGPLLKTSRNLPSFTDTVIKGRASIS